MANRLKTLSGKNAHPVALMRYLLNKSIMNNWSDIYDLKESDLDDFGRFLEVEYGITAGSAAAADEYF